MLNDLELTKTLSSSDRKLLIELRNYNSEILQLLHSLVVYLSQIETLIETIMRITDEISEIITDKENEL